MSLDVDDIIDPSRDLVVSVLVPQGPVPTEIETRVGTVVGVEKFLVISMDGSCHPGPRLPHTEAATRVGTNQFLTLQGDVLKDFNNCW